MIGSDGSDGAKAYALRVYDLDMGQHVATRYWPWFTRYDGFAAGNVFGPGKDNLICATNQDNIVYIGK